MGKNLLVKEKECKLLLASSIIDIIAEDYPWFETFIKENPKATYGDIKGDSQKEDFFNYRYDEILKLASSEWSSASTNPVEIKEWDDNIRCDLCNHHIIYVCTIVNNKNGKVLEVGSECVKRFGMKFHKDLMKVITEQKRFKRINILEKEIPGIENDIRGWNDEVEILPLLLPEVIDNPYRKLGEKAKGIFEDFVEEKSGAKNDQAHINELKDIIKLKEAKINEIREYVKEHESDKFVPNRLIIKWLEDRAKKDPEKYRPALQQLREDGRITMFSAWRIGEPNYLEALIPDFNRVFIEKTRNKVLGESWFVEELIQHRGTYGYMVNIPFMGSVFCPHENFIQEYGEGIFIDDADIKYDEKKLIDISTIFGERAIGSLIHNVESIISSSYLIYQFDEMMDEIIFALPVTRGNDYVYIIKKLRPFIEKFKYALLPTERDKVAESLKEYFDGLDKEKKISKQDLDFLLSQR